MKMPISFFIPIVTIFIFSSFYVAAQSVGDLDVTFGNNGTVITSISTSDDAINSAALQADGKIVVVGYSFNGTDNDFTVARYNTDGSLDNTFSSDGIVTTDAGGFDVANAVAIQQDGKIVVAGKSYHTFAEDITVVRYNTDGSLDNTFSTDGIVSTDIANYADIGLAIAIQPNGKIVVAGRSSVGSFPDLTVVRYNTDGTLDNTFSTDGVATVDFGTNTIGFAVALQDDGKIVVAGQTDNGLYSDFAVVRFKTDGTLDSTFSDDGIVTTPVVSANDAAYTVVIQTDGKIVAAGESDNGTHYNITVVRYNSDGTLDNTFSSDGIVTTTYGNSNCSGYSAALQLDGKIVVTGISDNGINFDFTVVRFNTDGSLDSTFSSDGITSAPVGNSGDNAYSVVIQPDGNIVVAGNTWNGSNEDFAVARFIGTTVISTEKTAKKEFIKIYPNPASDFITLNEMNINNDFTINIYNLIGELVSSESLSRNNQQINIVNLNNGIYIVEIISEGWSGKQKLVIKR